jgi:hypothetical protein
MNKLNVGVFAQHPAKAAQRRTMYKAVQGFARPGKHLSAHSVRQSLLWRRFRALLAQGYPHIRLIMGGAATNRGTAG